MMDPNFTCHISFGNVIWGGFSTMRCLMIDWSIVNSPLRSMTWRRGTKQQRWYCYDLYVE
ncbi:hypothetical protein BDV41DRAFT_518662 [Aspergillus transmontanensis]|uniref:Uncharacterized protein n=1 Tax=Aspergillus transmontanensis TaxID=1034304 RepID=A0A5N6WHK2_9EURO|nr:hypothetical protein BDV41DRAFT_518662 [Aspergillus transmontanensis]